MKIRIRLKDTGYTFEVDSEKCMTKTVFGDELCEITLTEEDVDRMNFWLKES